MVAWVGQEDFGDPERSWIGWVRKLQRNHLNGFKLVDDHVGQKSLPANRLLQGCEGASMENEFAEQRRHVDHATGPREGFRQPLLKVESSHRYRSRHGDGVRN